MIPQHTEIILGNLPKQSMINIYGDDMVMLPDHDNAIVGAADRVGQESILCYSIDIIIQNLIGDGEMTEDEAYVHFDSEIAGLWAGDRTPCFITFFRAELSNGD